VNAYFAKVAWGDGDSDSSTEANSPISISVMGQDIEVFGSHAFAASGALSVAVTLGAPAGASATAYATADVAADVSSQVGVSRSGLVYNRATRLFYGTLTIVNNSSTPINGSINILLQGLTGGVALTYASGYTIAYDSAGDPYLHIPQSALAALAPGQSLSISLRFSDPSLAMIGFTPKVLSDPFDG
jgi:hypothetical protein